MKARELGRWARDIWKSSVAGKVLLIVVALDGERLFGEALRLARRLRAEISALPGLRPFEPGDVLGRPGTQLFNELHVTFDVKDLGMTGYAAADWLRGQQHVAFELADHRRLRP